MCVCVRGEDFETYTINRRAVIRDRSRDLGRIRIVSGEYRQIIYNARGLFISVKTIRFRNGVFPSLLVPSDVMDTHTHIYTHLFIYKLYYISYADITNNHRFMTSTLITAVVGERKI